MMMTLTLLILFTLLIIPSNLSLPVPIPDAATIQPLKQNPSSSSSQGLTIPAFPEQADVARCPLSLSDEHFNGIKNACSSKSNKHHASSDSHHYNQLHRSSRCCPVLAAWLYSAYSATALGGGLEHGHTSSYDMPLLPDDSETCESDLGKALKLRGIQLFQPNETCDLVYCYCGIRLHPLSCPESFKLTHSGNLVGDESVKRLETNCLSSSSTNGFPGLGGCSKCLHSLYSLRKKSSNSSKSGDRTTKIHNKDCELMGLTWLLAKNRNAYIHTVTLVLRALMLNPDGSDPQSCTLNSDGMPLAVDSSELPELEHLALPYHVLIVTSALFWWDKKLDVL
ncbi:putative GPI-anchored protein [Trifolium pratense]|uniref:Putative GPI-anchored protein n=1 Tax=Trifolium pratense TaxID=57577 RepID=A0A2K3N5U8_TRIPR|nr:putative GPI-anchored protein [Trifolium pratense]